MSEINSIDFNELDEKDLTPDWVIKGWLEKGDLGMLAGEQYSGKSWISTYLALCVSKGETWIPRMEIPKARRVLIIDEDNKRTVIERRLQAFPQRMGRQPSEWVNDLRVWYGNGMTLAKCKTMHMGGDRFHPELIIIDSLYCFAGVDINKLEEAAKVKAEFRAMQAANGDCAILVLHHPRKSPPGTSTKAKKSTQDVSGSLGLTAMVDTLWLGKMDGDIHVLSSSKLRSDPEAGKRNSELRLTIEDHVVCSVA